MKLKLYEKVINPGLGECYLIKQKEEKYLFFVPNNFENFVITRQLLGRKDNCGFCVNEYISDLEEAIKRFKKD